jgi:hypothetical protein
MLLVQAQNVAARAAAEAAHTLGAWEPGTRYPGGEQDWWARCRRCEALVWVMATPDGRGVVQHVPGRCSPAA